MLCWFQPKSNWNKAIKIKSYRNFNYRITKIILLGGAESPLKIAAQDLSDYGVIEVLMMFKSYIFTLTFILIIVHSKVFNDEIFLAFLKRVKRVSSCLDNKGNYYKL